MSFLISPLSESIIFDAAQSIADGTAIDLRAVDHADRAKLLGAVIELIEQRVFLKKAKAALAALKTGDPAPAAEILNREDGRAQLSSSGGISRAAAPTDDFVRDFILSAEGAILLNILGLCLTASTGFQTATVIPALPICPFVGPPLLAEKYVLRRYLMHRSGTLGLQPGEVPSDADRLCPDLLTWANSLNRTDTAQLSAMGQGAIDLDLCKISAAGRERRAIFGRLYSRLGIRLDTVAPVGIYWAVPVLAAPLSEHWRKMLSKMPKASSPERDSSPKKAAVTATDAESRAG